MRSIVDFIIASVGCMSDNNYICVGVLIYVLIRVKQEIYGKAINS